MTSSHGHKRRVLRLALQLAGFGAGLGLLAWAVSIALREENRHQLERLADASIQHIAWLLGLSALSLVLNGLAFWAMLEPARRLRVLDVQATNAVATFLAYLPFKLGALTRVLIHNRRDGVPLLTIGAWFLALTAAMAIAIAPLLAASLVRHEIDAVWLAIAGAGVVLCTIATNAMARYFGFEKGMARLHRILDPITPGRLRPALRSARFRELHEGFAMLACPKALTMGVALRLADLLVQGARFAVAADVLGVDLSFADAVLLALSYFAIGVVSPSGMLGVREMGTTAIAAIAAMAASERFVGVALLVTAAESIATLAGAGVGLAWLRPDRLLRARGARSGGGSEPSS